MFAGTLPFKGRSGIETCSAILRSRRRRYPLCAASRPRPRRMQRIVDKCLAKDPDSRYQGMKDMVVDLRAARRRLESTSQAVPVAGRAPPPSHVDAGLWPDRRRHCRGGRLLVFGFEAGAGLPSPGTGPGLPSP